MFLKISSFSNQNKTIRDLDRQSREYPIIDDLTTEENSAGKQVNTVHRRRDLDSLG